MPTVKVNYKKLTVAQLKQELASRKLDTSGKKADLIVLLEEHDRLLEEEEDEEEIVDATVDAAQTAEEGNELAEGEGEEGVEDEEEEEAGEGEEEGDENNDDVMAAIPMGTSIEEEEDDDDEENYARNENEEETFQEHDNEEEEGMEQFDNEGKGMEQPDNEEELEQDDNQDNTVKEKKDDLANAEYEDEMREEHYDEGQDDEVESEMKDMKDVVKDETQDESFHGEEENEVAFKTEQGEEDLMVKLEDKRLDDTLHEPEGKVEEGDGVVIDAVGEVDDEEFSHNVADMEEKETGDAKKLAQEQSTKPLMSSSKLNSWFSKRVFGAQRFSSLHVHSLSHKQLLSDVMVYWARKARYFAMNLTRSGRGSALLTFVSDEAAPAAKEALSAELGDNVKIETPKKNLERDFSKEFSYSNPGDLTPTRTVLLTGIQAEMSLEKIKESFPAAEYTNAVHLMARVNHNEANYSWRNMDRYAFPEGFKEMVLVEFGSSKDAERAAETTPEFTIDDVTVSAKLLPAFFKEHEGKVEEARKARLAELAREREREAGDVFEDSERLSMCKTLRETVKERQRLQHGGSGASWTERMNQQQQLSKKILDLVRALDVDTDNRLARGLSFPEAYDLMTKHTRIVYNSHRKDSDKDSKEKKKESLTVKVQGDRREVGTVEEPINVDSEDSNAKGDKNKINTMNDDSHRQVALSKDGEMKVERRNAKSDQVEVEVSSRTSRDRDRDDKRESRERRNMSERSSRPSRFSAPSQQNVAENESINDEIEKLTMDLRGWYSLFIIKATGKYTTEEVKNIFENYGDIKEIHFQGNKAYVRYGHRGEILRAIKSEFGKHAIHVPMVADKYVHPKERERVARLKEKLAARAAAAATTGRGRGGRPKSRFDEPRGGGRPDRMGRGVGAPGAPGGGLMDQQQHPQPFALQNTLFQQQQQQLMLQQEMMLRQQQQAAMLQMQQQQQQQAMQGQQRGGLGLLGSGELAMQAMGLQGHMGMRGGAVGGPQMAALQQPAKPLIDLGTGRPISSNAARHSRRERSPPRRDRSPPRRDRSPHIVRDQTSGSRFSAAVDDRDRGGKYGGYGSKRALQEDSRHFDDVKRSRHTDSERDSYGIPPKEDAKTMAAVLKGLSQVISSQMLEMTGERGGAADVGLSGISREREDVYTSSAATQRRADYDRESGRGQAAYQTAYGRQTTRERGAADPDMRGAVEGSHGYRSQGHSVPASSQQAQVPALFSGYGGYPSQSQYQQAASGGSAAAERSAVPRGVPPPSYGRNGSGYM